MNTPENNPFQIWVDADACPAPVKEILYRTARRLQVELTLVANQPMHVPSSRLIRLITVTEGADIADDKIVEMFAPGDVVITGDVPHAARVVAKSAIAIGVRGEQFDENSVHDRLASRDLMEQFRSAGVDTRGPSPLTKKHLQTFANVLDRTLTRCLTSAGGIDARRRAGPTRSPCSNSRWRVSLSAVRLWLGNSCVGEAS